MFLLRLAYLSIKSRRWIIALVILNISVSVFLFVSIENITRSVKSSFSNTVSGTDLVIGGRTGNAQLLLYAIFRIGSPTNNVSWTAYQEISQRSEVDWILPISLGDSHKGFPVLGTTHDYFSRYKYQSEKKLHYESGQRFEGLFDAVIGATVAKELGYTVGDEITISHGLQSFVEHKDTPFRITGILERSETPNDRTVFVDIRAIEVIHLDWRTGQRVSGSTNLQEINIDAIEPKQITAALVGVKPKLKILFLQRWINEYPSEPLLAVIPAVTLSEIWSSFLVVEDTMRAVSGVIVTTSIIGMIALMLLSLSQRGDELRILRSVGANPSHIFRLFVIEGILTSVTSTLLGVISFYLCASLFHTAIAETMGVYLSLGPPTLYEISVLLAIAVVGAIASMIPATLAYLRSS